MQRNHSGLPVHTHEEEPDIPSSVDRGTNWDHLLPFLVGDKLLEQHSICMYRRNNTMFCRVCCAV